MDTPKPTGRDDLEKAIVGNLYHNDLTHYLVIGIIKTNGRRDTFPIDHTPIHVVYLDDGLKNGITLHTFLNSKKVSLEELSQDEIQTLALYEDRQRQPQQPNPLPNAAENRKNAMDGEN